MKIFQRVCLVLGLAGVAATGFGCYTHHETERVVYEPSGAVVVHQPAYHSYYDEGGRAYYYDRWGHRHYYYP